MGIPKMGTMVLNRSNLYMLVLPRSSEGGRNGVGDGISGPSISLLLRFHSTGVGTWKRG